MTRPAGRALERLRERPPSAAGTGPSVWADDARVVAARVLPPLAAAMALLVAVTVAAGLLVTRVADGAVGAADLALVEAVVDRRTPLLDRVTGYLTWPANTVVVLGVMALGAAVAALATRRWVAPTFLVAAVGGEKLAYLAAGLAVGRDRPPVPTLGVVHATTSFPSGHVASAVALYGAIALLVVWWPGTPTWSRRLAVAVAVVVPLAVGFSRVYRGVHYPTDVLAGALLAGAWLAVTWYSLAREFSPAASLRPGLVRGREPS